MLARMARKPRVEFEGAFYHVVVRGNQRQRIFRDDRDRIHYLERVEHYRQRYRFTIYAYVLMSNHVHLLLETGKTSLSKILQGILFTYTQYYNRLRIPTQIDTHSAGKTTLVPIEIGTCSDANRHPCLG